jgi:hypothetical protein
MRSRTRVAQASEDDRRGWPRFLNRGDEVTRDPAGMVIQRLKYAPSAIPTKGKRISVRSLEQKEAVSLSIRWSKGGPGLL